MGSTKVGDVVSSWDSVAGKIELTNTKLDDVSSSVSRATTIAVGVINIGTTQVAVQAGAAPLPGRIRMRVFCEGDDVVYIGPSGVATSTGYPILPGNEKIFEFKKGTVPEIYAVAASTQKLRVWEEA